MDEALHIMHQRLVDHMDGVSEGGEKNEVEALIVNDPVWARAWQDLLQTRAAIVHFGLKEKVSAIHQEMKTELKATNGGMTRRMLRPFLSVAAVFLLIIGGYFFYQFYTISGEKIFESNYQPYELSTVRGQETTSDSIEHAFRNREYEKVLRYTARMGTLSNREKFLSGISSLELKDYKLAKSYFIDILEKKQDLFKDEAEYYLAITCIMTKDYNEALDLLKNIHSEKQHPYYQEVSEKLIREVRMLSWK